MKMSNLCEIFESAKIHYESPRKSDDQIVLAINEHFEQVKF